MTRFDTYKQKFSKMHLLQLKHLKNQLEARETIHKNVAMRNKWVADQNRTNYRNEHDRISEQMAHSTTHPATKKRFEQRAKYLETLFSTGNV